ncbi:MAG: Fic family protein [Propionibacteriaceae bacterium]|nr:Fic family protein [Propionibacteriaceae bacterium]
MRSFDYGFLKSGRVPAGLLGLVAAIAEARERQRGRGREFGDALSGLERIARVQSVGTSNAIEGIVTSDARLRALVQGRAEPLDQDEFDIAGYRDALALVHEGRGALDVTEDTMRRLHETMLAYGPVPGGSYKQTDNAVLEIDAVGSRRVRFAPVPAAETPEAMAQLVLAYLDARSGQGVDPLLLAPCFILDFLCVHPFLDGNGRVSRLLTLVALYQAGVDVTRYVSYEAEINRTREEYYEALRASSVGWHEGANDYFPFLQYSLRAIVACYRELDRRLAGIGPGRTTKKDRVRAAVLAHPVAIRKSELADLLPDVSPTTIEAALGELVRQGVVVKTGAGRATAYAAPDASRTPAAPNQPDLPSQSSPR